MQEGHTVVGRAYNGVEGEKLIRLLQPDLAFVDIRMPFQDGLHVLENIKADQKVTSRIVMLTAFSEFHYAQQALRLGAFDYMLKPIAMNDLRNLFQRCMTTAVSAAAAGENKPTEETTLRSKAAEDPQIDHFLQEYLEALILEHGIRNQLLLDSLEVIRKQVHKPLTLQYLSATLHVSESYLSRLFTRDFGIGFIKLLNKLRIDLALYLLKHSKLTISEIAKVVGIDNVTYFGRVFKEITGRSASEYRHEEYARYDR
jgi:two-component system response regulator YesN